MGDAAIVRAIIALGHDLSLEIAAEGVGTLEQLRFLRAEGCDMVQGFLMSMANPFRQAHSPPCCAIRPRHTQPPPSPTTVMMVETILARLSASR